MKRKDAIVTIGATVVAGAAAVGAAPAAAARAEAPHAMRALLERVVPKLSSQFSLRLLPARDDGHDAFEISGSRGAVDLAGTSISALACAFNWYLKNDAGGQITWAGRNLEIGSVAPAPTKVRRATRFARRYVFNENVFGYSVPYWDWERWERELDVLAINGFNTAMQQIGMEAIWLDLFTEFGYSEEEMLKWIEPPAHQNWQWLGNIQGSLGGVSRELIDRRVAFGRRIIQRMFDLGISPVFPAFGGFVPSDFAERHRGAPVVPQGEWYGFERPAWLDPTSDLFETMAAHFYEHLHARFGLPAGYSVNVLHEGGVAGNVALPQAGKAIQDAMLRANPKAFWLLLAWQENPRREVVEKLDPTKLLIVDSVADDHGQWLQKDAFWGIPWTWGYINDYGSTTIAEGRLSAIAHLLPQAERLSRASRGNLVGVHIYSEGIDHNPVMFDLLTDSVWRSGDVDLASWLRGYVRRRYGADDPHAVEAWDIFARTAYGEPERPEEGGQQSIFNAQPALDAKGASPFIDADWLYDPHEFERGWHKLLAAADALRAHDGYRFDVCDITRQVLVNRGRRLLGHIRSAYRRKNSDAFTALTTEFLHRMDQLDELLGTRVEFMLGPWIAYARAWGATDAEADRLEYDARTIITTWGPDRKTYDALRDYANRDWSGLMRTFYKDRWSHYFGSLRTALEHGAEPEPIDWFEHDRAWTLRRDPYPTEPHGDTIAVARAIAKDVA
ncbi:MAG: alpha-N-acetylglucosaminidase [bacterium]|nr:alpha-N-acetylglucosaminidase [bacterium]